MHNYWLLYSLPSSVANRSVIVMMSDCDVLMCVYIGGDKITQSRKADTAN